MRQLGFFSILFSTLLVCSIMPSLSYGDTSGGHGGVSYAGKVDISALPKAKVQPHHFTMPFLPKSQSGFSEAKSKPKSIHLNNTMNVPAARTFASAIPPAVAAPIISEFYGMDQSQCNCSPPDVQIAVGPNNIVEMVNTSEEIWKKQGGALTTVSLYTFFSIPQSDFISDPRVIYDSSGGRWFASILDVSSDSVKIAVSETGDPTTKWNLYNVSFGANCPDQPSIATSDDKLVVSANDFSNCLTSPTLEGAEYFVIDKAQVMQGSQNPAMDPIGPDITEFSIMPAITIGSSQTMYMVSAYGSSNTMRLYSVSGTAQNATTHTADLSINTINIPPGAQQKGTSTTLETNDDRVLGAVWDMGKLWLTLTDSCTPVGDSQARSCVRVIEVDTNSSKVLQDFDYGTSGSYYFYPALTVDGNQNVDVIFGYSSSQAYPGLMLATENPSTTDKFDSVQVLKAGNAPDTSGRYGDYFDAVRDPSNATNIFVAGEIHSSSSLLSSSWDTFIASTEYVNAPEFQFSVPILLIGMISLAIIFRINKGVAAGRNS